MGRSDPARPADLSAAARVVRAAPSLPEALQAISDASRRLVGAHQCATSLVPDGNWAHAIHAVSLDERYAAWRDYAVPPDGSGIYRLVCELNRPLRLSQRELEAHPAWRGFGTEAGRHPPMRGWLAAPLRGRGDRSIGVIQLSDRDDGDFTEADEAVLVDWARLASAAIDTVRRRARARRRTPPG